MPRQKSAIPIYVMLLIFGAAAFAMFVVMPPEIGNDILDGFVLAATIIGGYRFWPYGAESILKKDPTGPNFLVASAFLLCVSIAAIRALRIIGLELGIITSAGVNYAFGAITTLMAFGIVLLVASPELRTGKLMMDRTVSIAVFVLLSGAMSVGVYVLRTTF